MDMLLIAIAIAIGVGVVIMVAERIAQGVNDYNFSTHLPSRSDHALTKTEFLIGSILTCAVIAPLTVMAGTAIAQDNSSSYKEFWSGMEKEAVMTTVECTKDGSCSHTYQCDPYFVTVPKTRTVSDGKGGTRTETYTVTETRYHDCPYVTHENTFTVTDTMGEKYVMGGSWFPENPQDHVWRGSGAERTHLPNIPTGQPTLWVEAKNRIDSGNHGGTTKVVEYQNLILASQSDIYDRYSDAIDDYKSQNMMPSVQTKTYDHYKADKVYLMGGLQLENERKWQEELARLNAHVGPDLGGDVHVVMVPSGSIANPDEYTAAIGAYWQSPELGKNTLSKNGVVVVMGVNSGNVAWTRAFTGMPMGNEGLEVTAREVKNVKADPSILRVDGLLGGKIMNDFERVPMEEFSYLKDSIPIGFWSKFWIITVATVLSAGCWVAMLALDIQSRFIENLSWRRRSA